MEDEKAVRRMTEHLLRREGYAVLSAECGAAALALARSHPGPIHLLLTDVRLPDVDGLALAEAVRAERPKVRVVYQSGDVNPELLGRLPGGGHFLQKPFTPNQLSARVREALA